MTAEGCHSSERKHSLGKDGDVLITVTGHRGSRAPPPRRLRYTHSMQQAIQPLHVSTRGRGLIEITAAVHDWVDRQEIATGLLTLFCRHTSASLVIQENADPNVRADLEAFFARLAPEDPQRYHHDTEGADDMPAHLRAALTQTQLSIPIDNGKLLLGTWQGIYLFEHRRAPQQREVVLHLICE